MLLVFILMLIAPYADNKFWGLILPEGSSIFLIENIFRIRAFFFIFSIMSLVGYLVEGFYLSHYFKKAKVDFEVARLVYGADNEDMTASFLCSRIGEYTMDKLGITDKEIKHFLKDEDRDKIKDRDLHFYYNARNSSTDDDKVVNLPDYLKSIFNVDRDFRDFLIKNNINEDEFFGALEWIQNIAWKIRNKERFWSKENLVRIPSIGKNWYLDNSQYLNKYSHLIYENMTYQSLGKDWYIFRDEAEQLEDLMLDQKLNNALLVSDDVGTGMQIVSAFGKMIIEGKSLPKFENKKMYVLNIESLIFNEDGKDKFHTDFLNIISEATYNEDIILVIPNLADFMEMSMELGVDIFGLLKKIMSKKSAPLIAVVTKNDFYSLVEPDFELLKNFDKFIVPSIDEKFILRILQNEAHIIENKDKKNITYPVLEKIAVKYLNKEDSIKESLAELHRIYE
jgi:ATP-dependent Clp protease ATP-binding subunit ClpA